MTDAIKRDFAASSEQGDVRSAPSIGSRSGDRRKGGETGVGSVHYSQVPHLCSQRVKSWFFPAASFISEESTMR